MEKERHVRGSSTPATSLFSFIFLTTSSFSQPTPENPENRDESFQQQQSHQQ